MHSKHIVRSAQIQRTPRVAQLEGIFDIPMTERSSESWDVTLPIDEKPWQIGLIVGPSGAGKSTVAREFFGDSIIEGYEWPKDKAIIDGMPKGPGIKDITAALSSVGFGSPPNWLRPFHVLSVGEQFRATCARALLEPAELIAIDEFTSTVDRQVAQVASSSIAKAVRRSGKRLVAIGCHYDVIEWLQPDWIYQPHINEFTWRLLRRRPEIELKIGKVDRSAWRLFHKYHYLSSQLSPSAQCFGAFIDDRCVAFTSYIHFPHPHTKNIKQGHRTVVLPDYQGLGLGGRLTDWLGQYLYEQGYRYHTTVAHPAMIAYRNKSPRWRCLGKTAESSLRTKKKPTDNSSIRAMKRKQNDFRRLNTMTFEYQPPKTA